MANINASLRHKGATEVGGGAADGGDFGVEADAVLRAERGEELVHVLLRAAVHGEPRVLGVQAEEAVIVEEAQQRDGGELQHQLGRRAPDRAAHGHEIKAEEVVAVAARADVVGHGHGGERGVGERGDGFGVEAVDLREHPPKARAEEVPALGEEVV